jgi:ribulose-phosphate 3-epimerase
MATIQISPSLLSANFAQLGQEVKALEVAGADRLHLDVMDGHFVPNLTFGPAVIKALRPYTTLPFEAHLMIAPCEPYLESYAKAGADLLLIHPESGPHLYRSLQIIKGLGKKAGVVLNPATPVELLCPVLDIIDQVLIMTVNPGFGGQSFIAAMLPKIQAVHTLLAGRAIEVAVDGGITTATAPACLEAGATVLVAGTAVFQSQDYQANMAALRP